MSSRSVEFFDRQFQRQSQAGEYALNPFESAALPYLHGEVLDLGCGMGNLALAAARAGCTVTALDASPAAIADLSGRARQAGLPVRAEAADLRAYSATLKYDCVVSIGLLMFFACTRARAVLLQIARAVRPGGIAAINVLVEGTTFMDMFDPSGYCLFGPDELRSAFDGWETLLSKHEEFPAPGGTVKRFHTLIARRPPA
jgi:tellurite methyltransferase